MKTSYFLYCCLFVSFSLMLGSAVTTLSHTSFSIPSEVKDAYTRLVPQGWSFFTRNPKEELLMVYKIENDQYDIAFRNNNHISNFFGASRMSRRLAFEYSAFIQIMGSREWIPHTGTDFQSIINLPTPHTLSLKEASKNITPGKYLFVMQDPVPWAWMSNFNEENTKSRYVLIDIVDCSLDQLANN